MTAVDRDELEARRALADSSTRRARAQEALAAEARLQIEARQKGWSIPRESDARLRMSPDDQRRGLEHVKKLREQLAARGRAS